ncbi:MAG: hypothetical protein JXK16_12455 [Thiotrichales bacterium]|nr:hypothetical protein [Thiotrichales bacterium]
MKNLLLTTLFTGLLFAGNASMAMSSSQDESAAKAPKVTTMNLPETAKELEQKAETNAEKMTQDATKKAADKLSDKTEPQAQSTEIIDEMVQSKLETQMMVLASAEKVENCWAWNACIDRHRDNEAGYDSYAFN